MGQIGRFQLRGEIARGGMGVVYDAYDPELKREVAIKQLKGLGSGPELLRRFEREATALSRLRHPHVVAVHEQGVDQGIPYLVMQRIQGTSLTAHIKIHGPLVPRRAAQIALQLSEALAHAHKAGILHRDLNPANVLLDEAGDVFLTDFGLAKVLDAHTQLTQDGQLMGTRGFMPPEQAFGELEKIGPPTDVYGLGATLYYMLTGLPPILSDSLAGYLAKLSGGPPPSNPSVARPGVSPQLDKICLKCLRRDPTERYPSAEALGQALQATQERSVVLRRSLQVLGLVLLLSLPLWAYLVWGAAPAQAYPRNQPEEGSVQSEVPAHQRLRQAADAGHLDALVAYGQLLERGDNVEQDEPAALACFQAAAEENHLEGLYHYGRLAGHEPSLRTAADQGHALAMLELGRLLKTTGTEHEQEEALEWFHRAARLGERRGWVELRWLLGSVSESAKQSTLEWLLQAADSGDTAAMLELAFHFMETKDAETGHEWTKRAADAGDLEGLRYLGSNYQHGSGVAQDFSEAARLYTQAAEAGDATSMYWLAALHEKGLGLPQSWAKSTRWLQRAAEAGVLDALNLVGERYRKGQGVALDSARAAEWFRRAAKTGDYSAMTHLGEMLELGEGMERDAEAAARWHRQAFALGGGTGPMRYMGAYHQESDPERAAAWFRRAADLGDEHAAEDLDRLLAGSTQETRPLADLRNRAEQGDSAAALELGVMYYHGRGVAQDHSRAAEWYRRAAEGGSPAAMTFYGNMLEHGLGLSPDRAEAIRWYEQAANLGQTTAMLDLGSIYYGDDPPQAMAWFRKAAAQGEVESMYLLASLLHYTDALQDLSEAEAWYRDVLKRQSKHSRALYHLSVLLRAKNPGEAEGQSLFQQAVDMEDEGALLELRRREADDP